MSERLIIVRNGAPHQYDQAPIGTICKVIINEHCHERFIQRSANEEKPQWESLGVFYNDDPINPVQS